ncbi:MAG: nitrate ABC transporter, permease protein, partial [Planctomycetota bacterium]
MSRTAAPRVLGPVKATLLSLVGIFAVLATWAFLSAGPASNLPSPIETWRASRIYLLEPFAKRGELDQGILRFTFYSLALVIQGYLLALLAGVPLGFLLGRSPVFARMFDP